MCKFSLNGCHIIASNFITATDDMVHRAHCLLILRWQILRTALNRAGQLQTVYNFNSCHVFACPEASALLNPTCCVVSGVPVTDSSWGYFLPLSTVWAFLTDGGWLGWLEHFEWQWLAAWWHGGQSEVRGGDRWATVSHWGGHRRRSAERWPVKHQCHRLQPWLLIIWEARHHSKLQICFACVMVKIFVSRSGFWYGTTDTISTKLDGGWVLAQKGLH